MTQEDKNLLLKDLSARLSYGVKISVNDKVETLQGINVLDKVAEYGSFLSCGIEEVKPYLFPLSSMTEEQFLEYHHIKYNTLTYRANWKRIDVGKFHNVGIIPIEDYLDWFDANHFDYRGLIPMGLANDASGLNIY